jgi:hypothetical protein
MRSPRVPWWPGSVVSGSGLHIHHLVFGVWLMLLGGTLGFWFSGTSPWLEVSAVVFGIGAGLTFDEFALLVYLKDVYWAEEGRASIDATVIAVAGMALVVLGAQPFQVTTSNAADIVGSVASGLVVLAFVLVCFAKQRLLHGAVGFFLLPLAIYGAVRLAKPRSPWARRRYGTRNPDKQARAVERFAPDRRTERVKERFRDLIGGAPSDVAR